METQLLRTFVVAAEAGSISAAAAQLGYVQSSVSEQVRRLESDLGVTLLTRTSTGVSPTAEGRRLLPDAERVLAALDDLRRTTSEPARLRVGTVDTLAVRWLPDVVGSLPANQRPTIIMNRRDLLLRELIDGRCDVAILYRPRGAPLPHLGAGVQAAVNRLGVEVLGTDELLVVTATDPATQPADGWLVTQTGCVHREVSLLDEGSWGNAHEPAVPGEMASVLARLIELSRPLATLEGLHSIRDATQRLWRQPHDRRFDFPGTAHGAEWIDRLFRAANERVDQLDLGPGVLGHCDYRAEHVRFTDGLISAVYDWDSLAVGPEPVVVGWQRTPSPRTGAGTAGTSPRWPSRSSSSPTTKQHAGRPSRPRSAAPPGPP